APGYTTARRSVTVAGPQRLTINLEKAPVAPSPVTTAPAPANTPAAVVASAPAPASEGSRGLRGPLGVGAAIGAGVVLIGSIVETVIWQNKRGDFNGRSDCGEDMPGRGAAGCKALYDDSRSAATLAIIGYAITGALGIGAAVLLLTGNDTESSTTRVACAPGWGPSLVGCRLTF